MRGLAWAACIAWSVMVAVQCDREFVAAESAPQQCAVVGMNLFYLVLGYVLARAVDKLTVSFEAVGSSARSPSSG